ncbi:MAG: hypothetical protein ABIA04_00185 [Pseudomonadota bacterium]
MKRTCITFLFFSILILILSACLSSDDTSVADSGTDGPSPSYSLAEISGAFPEGVAVTSPGQKKEAVSAALKSETVVNNLVVELFEYEYQVETIQYILLGQASQYNFSTILQNFEPSFTDADCYGPELIYENHEYDDSDGTLLLGDLGIWLETEPDTDEACAIAQLNKKLEMLSEISFASFALFAYMIYEADQNGAWEPALNSTVDLTNDLSISDVTVNEATIEHTVDANGNDGADYEVWNYKLDFDYTDSNSEQTHIVIYLSHKEGDTDDDFSGRLTYMVNGDSFYNLKATGDISVNGSVVYNKKSASELHVEALSAIGSGIDTWLIDNDGLVDKDSSWLDYFTIATMNFNPDTDSDDFLSGEYVLSWQAGKGDGSTRTLLLGLNEANEDGIISGEAWYGFGEDVEDADGSLIGFFCNWMAPGSNFSNYLQYAQRQHITYNPQTGIYEPTNAAASNITYAPTNTCLYAGGDFIYDRNLDDILDSNDVIIVTDPITTGLEFDLYAATDVDGDGTATIWETIQNRGYTLPDTPVYEEGFTK